MFKVKKERCSQCLYSKDKIVSNERRSQLLRDIKQQDSYFVCHQSTIEGEDACCKGFYESASSNAIRMFQRLHMIEMVN